MRRAAFSIILLLLTGCVANEGARLPSAVPSERPELGGRVVLPGGAFRTLQPVLSFDDQSQNVWRFFYEPLTKKDPDTGMQAPNLARTFGISSDGLTVSFALRDGIVWSDGVSVTGDDYRYTVEAIARSQKTALKARFQEVVGWKDYAEGRADRVTGIDVSPDGRTITVRLRQVSCSALWDLGNEDIPPLPRHRFVGSWNNRSFDAGTSIDANPLNDSPPVSDGAFIFKERVPGERLSMVANDRYWKGRPLIDELVYVTTADALAALLTGEVHFGSAAPALVDDVKRRGAGIIDLHQLPATNNYRFIGWNQASTGAPWLRDVRVRQALWYGLDVKSIVQSYFSGYAHQVFGHFPTTSWAYTAAGLNTYPYEMKRAKSLLDSAGAVMGADSVYRWTDGRPMRLTLATSSDTKERVAIAQIVKEQYAAIGIAVDLRLLSFAQLSDALNRRDQQLDGVLLGQTLGPEWDIYRVWHSRGGENFFAYNNPELDRLIDAARLGPDCSEATLKTLYAAANRILNDQAPAVFLYSQDNVFFTNTALRGLVEKPYGGIFWNVEKWWIKR